jgi:hypothetical protein|tara:strand:- start:871 stop:1068 length:198 start_codon:yes stop_codon:yes gene_type:complete
MKMKTFKIYSSETVFYETIVKAKNEDDAYSKFNLELEDEVDRKEYQTDNIEEITSVKEEKESEDE